MKVVELTAYHVRIPLRKPIRHASHSRTETDNVLVRCVLDNRVEGFGEGVPRDYVTGETVGRRRSGRIIDPALPTPSC